MTSPRELALLNELVRRHGFSAIVAGLSAIAGREAHKLEQSDPDPRRYAESIGEYVWIAELLGRCADEIDEIG